ncbi:hypothetical protein GALMADRAFT_232387 [Galerina marginata CBS 339.88]|uniref:AMP-dependent synthetase/ligase domain-containing protein n=1 Tax=Galerina marginata (strain CBS 339.88) TaxID=685588 RepID=A0A067SIT2_GALM3|nr:hypothetical protein GALMADRAFT_232387 [Galerina marginata CBS 339.88]
MAHFINQFLSNLTKYSSSPLVKVYVGSPGAPAWNTITYQDFQIDMEKVAAYWYARLTEVGIPQNSVVGLWLTGHAYSDLIHLYGLTRAGYIPQTFSVLFSYPGQEVVRDLLTACNGKAIIHDIKFAVDLFDIPSFVTPSIQNVPKIEAGKLLAVLNVDEMDMAMVFHTSGTTGGRPKPVPCTHRWLNAQVHFVSAIWDGEPVNHSIVNNIGSFAHLGSATSISYLAHSGSCLIQTSKADMDTSEFYALVEQGGMNRCLLYASWLSRLLEISKKDSRLLSTLKSMRQLTYTGASLNPENEKWVFEQGIPVTVMYATTEISPVLASKLDDLKLLPAMKIIPGTNVEFIPSGDIDISQLDLDSQKRATGGMLYDLFIPESFACCPHPVVRNRPNGHITGDLFEEIAPGYYAFRGRSDDWIRTGRTWGFCDTKAVEDNVLLVCADLVSNCVVVGHYKTSVVLLVEPSNAVAVGSEDGLKESIMDRTQEFRSRQFIHERLRDAKHIIIASQGSLPRTKEKGNIRFYISFNLGSRN